MGKVRGTNNPAAGRVALQAVSEEGGYCILGWLDKGIDDLKRYRIL